MMESSGVYPGHGDGHPQGNTDQSDTDSDVGTLSTRHESYYNARSLYCMAIARNQIMAEVGQQVAVSVAFSSLLVGRSVARIGVSPSVCASSALIIDFKTYPKGRLIIRLAIPQGRRNVAKRALAC
nr:hypothetical protein CFP56_26020 [Quercus suber]